MEDEQVKNKSTRCISHAEDRDICDGDIKLASLPVVDASTSTVSNVEKSLDPEQSETEWEKLYKDAEELDSLAFSVRRDSARMALLKLTQHMKLFSMKMKQTITQDENRHLDDAEYTSTKKRITKNDTNDLRMKKPRIDPCQVPQSRMLNTSELRTNEELKNEESIESNPKADCKPHPPMLKSKAKWVKDNMKTSENLCESFELCSSCPAGHECNRDHIFRIRHEITISNINHRYYSQDDLFRIYQAKFGISLKNDDISERIKSNELNTPMYTCCFICPVEKICYYAQPFFIEDLEKCVKSSQGIWWFQSMRESKTSLCTMVMISFLSRGLLGVPSTEPNSGGFMSNQASKPLHVAGSTRNQHVNMLLSQPSIVQNEVPKQFNPHQTSQNGVNIKSPEKSVEIPLVSDPNFAESDCHLRCLAFNSHSGCQNGSFCRYAHVYFPKVIRSNTHLSDEPSFTMGLLSKVYREIFNISIDDYIVRDSPFRITVTMDNHRILWYSAAFKCPVEKTIYYACGGSTGILNPQNIFLYPKAEDAKTAAVSVLLDSISSRGLLKIYENIPSVNMNHSAVAVVPNSMFSTQRTHNACQPIHPNMISYGSNILSMVSPPSGLMSTMTSNGSKLGKTVPAPGLMATSTSNQISAIHPNLGHHNILPDTPTSHGGAQTHNLPYHNSSFNGSSHR